MSLNRLKLLPNNDNTSQIVVLTYAFFLLQPLVKRVTNILEILTLQNKQQPYAFGATSILKVVKLVGRHFTDFG